MIPNKVLYILTDLLPMIILFSIVMISLRVIYILCSKEKLNLYKEFKLLIYIIYTFILFKLVTTTDFESFSNNFIPFKEISRYNFSSVLFYRNVVGNILLFVPFGYMIMDMISDRPVKFKFIPVLSLTLITSFSIELIQMNIGRSYDVDDIILNLLGGLIGYILYQIIHLIEKKLPKILTNNIIKFILTFVLILTVIIIVLRGV